jgi:gluconate 2-dehydrogenase gamma chain
MKFMDRREFLELLAGLSVLVPGLVGEPAWAEAHERAQATRKLRTLSPLQDATVTRVADILVPETDTVGATGVGVTAFIDLLLSESMLPMQRDRFLEGLAAINARSQQRYGVPLPAAKPAEPVAKGLLLSRPIIPGRYDGCIPV